MFGKQSISIDSIYYTIKGRLLATYGNIRYNVTYQGQIKHERSSYLILLDKLAIERSS